MVDGKQKTTTRCPRVPQEHDVKCVPPPPSVLPSPLFSGGGLSSTGGDGQELSANTYAACKLSSQFGWYTTVALALLVAAAVLILPAVDGVVRTTMIDRGERGHHHFWWTASRTAALQAPSGTGVRHHWETQGIPSAEGAQGAADQG